jgi:hypothetical protein
MAAAFEEQEIVIYQNFQDPVFRPSLALHPQTQIFYINGID